MSAKMAGHFLAAALFLFLFWLIVTNFVRWNVFMPTAELEMLPSDAGLDFEDLYIDTRDGKKINAWFIPAENPRAVLIFFHGNGGNMSHRLGFARIFNTMGLAQLMFDYRGYGKSTGRVSEKGTYLDARAVYGYIKSRPDLAGLPVVLMGRSLGAAVAVDLALDSRVSAVIIEGAFTSVEDVAKEYYPFMPPALIRIKYDTFSKISSLSVPLLVMHCAKDEIIPFSHGRRLYDKAAGIKEFLELEGGHNDAPFLDEVFYRKGLEGFLGRYI